MSLRYRTLPTPSRLEAILGVLICLIISTRLIWLQIDDQKRFVSSEFYATTHYFETYLERFCPQGIESQFNDFARQSALWIEPNGQVSPGLLGGLLGYCFKEKLSLDSLFAAAPYLIMTTTLLVSIIVRILTSSWICGLASAAILLSRGSLMQGPHFLGIFTIFQPVLAAALLCALLFLRTQQFIFFNLMALALILCSLISQSFAPLTLSSFILLYFLLKRFQPEFFQEHAKKINSTMAIHILTLTALVAFLRAKLPESTKTLSLLKHQIIALSHGQTSPLQYLGAAIAEMEHQDIHWLCSFAAICLAAVFRRYLPHKVGSWFAILLFFIGSALLLDGAIIAVAARQDTESSLMQFYSLKGAVFNLEPIVIGVGAGLMFFAIRTAFFWVIPSYKYE